jgi:hypothetical protein|tara:strand:+ start:638 stop:817 length:180 start_codon:yes stop_codon:yes gene_type:complete
MAAGIKNRNATLHKIDGIPDHLPKPWHTPPMYPFLLYSFLFMFLFLFFVDPIGFEPMTY